MRRWWHHRPAKGTATFCTARFCASPPLPPQLLTPPAVSARSPDNARAWVSVHARSVCSCVPLARVPFWSLVWAAAASRWLLLINVLRARSAAPPPTASTSRARALAASPSASPFAARHPQPHRVSRARSAQQQQQAARADARRAATPRPGSTSRSLRCTSRPAAPSSPAPGSDRSGAGSAPPHAPAGCAPASTTKKTTSTAY